MIVREKITLPPQETFLKVVVDVRRRIAAYGRELHIDCADELEREGSERRDLWGANIYPQDKKVEFVSLINIRPADGNRSMEIQIPEIKVKVEDIIRTLFF